MVLSLLAFPCSWALPIQNPFTCNSDCNAKALTSLLSAILPLKTRINLLEVLCALQNSCYLQGPRSSLQISSWRHDQQNLEYSNMILKLEESSEMPDDSNLHSFQPGLDFTTTTTFSHPRQPYFKTEKYPNIKNNLVLPISLNSAFHSSQTIKKALLFSDRCGRKRST